MVGFGKQLRALQNPEWKQYYINYKMMKRKVKNYAAQAREGGEGYRQFVVKEFSKMLDRQIEKIVLFLIEQQGDLAGRLATLGEERDTAKINREFSRINELRDEYILVGNDLLKLLHFVDLNATGLQKILKKFDKRVGYRLTDYYVASRSNHPYSQLQHVFRHVGIGAMVGALSRSLASLQCRTLSFSMYDEPLDLPFEEPIILAIKAAEEKLTNSTNALKFLGAHALIEQDEMPQVAEEYMEVQYHFMSLVLNLVNTFLYMVNTYIIVPTADKYALSLGAAATLCGIIIGSMAVAQLVSSIYFSAWSNKSYFKPLIFSSIILLFGNVLYAIAYDMHSLPLLLAGRMLCGFGSARAVNRRYISDWVPLKKRLQASAAFVSASALGMAAGPAVAGFFEINRSFLGFTLNANTLPGWVMAGCWLLYLIWLPIAFKEPIRQPESKEQETQDKVPNEGSTDTSHHYTNSEIEEGLREPLLLISRIDENNEEECDLEAENSDNADDTTRPAGSFMEAYRLLTTPVKVQLFIYFMLKYVMEIFLSESSVVSAYYFNWDTQNVALFLALLGLTVLPINILVGSYISNMFEDRQILFTAELITCLGVCISFAWPIKYTVFQYVSGALIAFVAAEVLEGVNLSLLSKVMSSRLARGTYNNGLLSTEAGTLARVVADGTITLAGYLGQKYLLNATLAPTFLLGLLSLMATSYSYNSMF